MKQLFALLLALAFGAAQAQALQPPEIAARSYLLFDATSNQVLAAKDADVPTEPASLTKLMTAYLVFQALKDKKLAIDQELPVSERAWRTGMTGASRTFINVNTRVKVEDLIKGMIVQSGNDATVALAEAVGGSVETFVDMMNRQAQAFGLKSTAFKNPEGLTAPGHTSTARELGVIATRLLQDFPQDVHYYAMKDFTYNKIKQPNRNLLLYRDPTVDGLKTGYTDAAGYCLIATAKRDFPNGPRRLVTVVLGAASTEARANESQKLLNWGFSAFDTVKLFGDGQPIVTPEVWKGASKLAKLGASGGLLVTVPRGEGNKLKTEVQRTDPLVAPLAKGQRVGTIKVTSGTATVAELPLVVLEPVEQAGFFGRMWDALRLWIK
ncbi:D-alanyl-D-alanine carboxypeptidase family protein [Methylibium rhizosphaerae]|uniref:D-alanyl-D-alanine carboxypeptidase family protein n=1 Tax=Methylibium rhizosphaerae TaxID=2570323 RepID=UPI001129B6CC|nr:D-alanyl-D-alanine carboxypeptidase family protein [Methylibium rhizosphaerae]